MKKILSLLLVAVLTIGFCTAAYAVAASYYSTQAFLAELDEKGITYTVVGLDEDNDEKVKVNNTDDNGFSYTINYFFDDQQENCSLIVWNIINYDDVDLAKVLRVCNSLNKDYKYIRFYVDESDNTVTAQYDSIFRTNDIDEILWEATLYMVDILEEAYPTLAVYDK